MRNFEEGIDLESLQIKLTDIANDMHYEDTGNVCMVIWIN